jgi:hypothetical protein
MSERIVNIHADGKLAYTGYLSRAAKRCDLTVAALTVCINKRANLLAQQPRIDFVNAEGKTAARPKAAEYIATFALPALRPYVYDLYDEAGAVAFAVPDWLKVNVGA